MNNSKKVQRLRIHKRRLKTEDLTTTGKLLTSIREKYTSQEMYDEVVRLKRLAYGAQVDGEDALAKAFLFGAMCGTLVHVRLYDKKGPPHA